ncbi:MAG: glutamate 5-kinase [Deltaproteobacteria bacterium]|nr:glutamate 5-kinase [Deltaproteobacteria bacterium]
MKTVRDKDIKESRKALIKRARRVVIKVGSGVLTGKDGLNRKIIRDLASDMCALRKKSIEVILVSSGAISSGLSKIGLTKRPDSISGKQAVAAVGQASLIMAWEKVFERHGQKVAQILITRDDFNHRGRYLNARNTIFTLLAWKIVPIINENDTVVVDEIKFGDNDNLSAMVTSLVDAQFLVSLTDLEGLYDMDPRVHEDAHLIPVVDKVSREIFRFAGSIPGFLGTGGMRSKIRAAQKASLGGVPTVIANGTKPGIIRDIFRGEEVGTFFLPQDVTLCSRKRWIAFTKAPKGGIVIDPGAERAIVHGGKSLLPSGIKDVRGAFGLGDSVVLLSQEGQELAVGMANYDAGELRKIMGLKTSEIEKALGYKHDDEVIHRDNLVLGSSFEEGGIACR